MKILQWLFKVAHEPPRETRLGSTNGEEAVKDQRPKSEKLVLFNNGRANKKGGEIKFGFKILNPISLFLRRKDISKACFHSTLNLKRLGSFGRQKSRIRSVKFKKEEMGNEAGSENKVLPIGDEAVSFSIGVKEGCEDGIKSEKNRRVSRVKVLLRWAAAAKSVKGEKCLGRKVTQFGNKATQKADDDQLSIDSPKISFSWDIQSCSTSSTDYSRTENWITTDSEFVVLEL